ncbi:MAG: hypothetical protein OEU89_04195, partial [Burkholderiaceae bacterium]|nr:hypothetical protein [Burkholderiaceae bacterium]
MQRKRTRRSKSTSQGAARPRAAQRAGPGAGADIISTLRRAGRPLRLDEITATLGPAAVAEAPSQLTALVRNGDLVLNRRGQYCLREQLPGLVVGTLQAHRSGDGQL